MNDEVVKRGLCHRKGIFGMSTSEYNTISVGNKISILTRLRILTINNITGGIIIIT